MGRAIVVIALLAAGCGGGDEPDRAQPAPREAERAPAGRSASPREAERVIRGWVAAVRRADFERAASYFALPARVQNGGPPQWLETTATAVAWNQALPCGAVVTGVRRASAGFVIAEFRLTDRVGSSCGTGTGAAAHSAILVEDGRIRAWYRLPDPPSEETPEQPDQQPRDPGVVAYLSSTALYL